MLKEMKETVCQANLDLVRHGLVIFTWGNVSGIDRDKGLVVIKPSGVPYDELKADDMVVLDPPPMPPLISTCTAGWKG